MLLLESKDWKRPRFGLSGRKITLRCSTTHTYLVRQYGVYCKMIRTRLRFETYYIPSEVLSSGTLVVVCTIVRAWYASVVLVVADRKVHAHLGSKIFSISSGHRTSSYLIARIVSHRVGMAVLLRTYYRVRSRVLTQSAS